MLLQDLWDKVEQAILNLMFSHRKIKIPLPLKPKLITAIITLALSFPEGGRFRAQAVAKGAFKRTFPTPRTLPPPPPPSTSPALALMSDP